MQKVFPEAAAAAGLNQDANFGLPSDDSDDNDYDPDGLSTDENDQGDESSSDESDFTSMSEDLEASANDKEYLGLPSDDSEDDEYNPDAPELDEKVMQENSSSDFTSDSEDLAGVLENSWSSGNEEGSASVSLLRDSNGKRSKLGGNKESLNNELLSILEPGQDGAAPVYGKRSIERLDYKKLYTVSVISKYYFHVLIPCTCHVHQLLVLCECCSIFVCFGTPFTYMLYPVSWIYFSFLGFADCWSFICLLEYEKYSSPTFHLT